jgi:hypothetical protein
VQAIAEAHHGSARVSSTPGQGSVFEVLLPLTPATSPAEPPAPPGEPPAPPGPATGQSSSLDVDSRS